LVIDTFLVWTAYNSVRHHDGPGTSRLEECEHFFRNSSIAADIGPFGEPTPKVCDVDILGRHDANRELRGCGVVWAVERDRCDWIAAKSSRALLRRRLRARSSMSSLLLVRDRESKAG
jgi:hypothetical protein